MRDEVIDMKMSSINMSFFVFGVYLSVLGTSAVVTPNILLALFGLPPTDEVWIRMAGMLLLFLAFYYIQVARNKLTDFYRWTVYARATVILFLTVFVVLSLTKPILILFGAIDLACALWTGVALRTAKIS